MAGSRNVYLAPSAETKASVPALTFNLAFNRHFSSENKLRLKARLKVRRAHTGGRYSRPQGEVVSPLRLRRGIAPFESTERLLRNERTGLLTKRRFGTEHLFSAKLRFGTEHLFRAQCRCALAELSIQLRLQSPIINNRSSIQMSHRLLDPIS